MAWTAIKTWELGELPAAKSEDYNTFIRDNQMFLYERIATPVALTENPSNTITASGTSGQPAQAWVDIVSFDFVLGEASDIWSTCQWLAVPNSKARFEYGIKVNNNTTLIMQQSNRTGCYSASHLINDLGAGNHTIKWQVRWNSGTVSGTVNLSLVHANLRELL